MSIFALGICMVCLGFLAIEMRAYCYGAALVVFGLLFIFANLLSNKP